MSTLLEALREQDSSVHNNYNANLTVNEFAQLQESFGNIPGEIVFRAEMIPVQKFTNESGDIYCVEMEDFARLRRSQGLDEATALSQIFEAIKSEPENDIESMDEIAIVLEKEDPEQLEKKIKSNPEKIDAKCEAVEMYMEMLNRITNTGAQILCK